VLTANPLIGVAVAIATRFAAAEAVGYVEGQQQARVQQAIAVAGGAASVNEVVTWATVEDPWFDATFGMVGGRLEVVREFGKLIICRELLYAFAEPLGGVEGILETAQQDVVPEAPSAPTPLDQSGAAWPEAANGRVMAAVICNGGQGWRWAVSRPATDAP